MAVAEKHVGQIDRAALDGISKASCVGQMIQSIIILVGTLAPDALDQPELSYAQITFPGA